MNLKKLIGKVFTSKFVGTGPSSSERKNLPGRGLTKVQKHCSREYFRRSWRRYLLYEMSEPANRLRSTPKPLEKSVARTVIPRQTRVPLVPLLWVLWIFNLQAPSSVTEVTWEADNSNSQIPAHILFWKSSNFLDGGRRWNVIYKWEAQIKSNSVFALFYISLFFKGGPRWLSG